MSKNHSTSNALPFHLDNLAGAVLSGQHGADLRLF
jgi:hypothetical protein